MIATSWINVNKNVLFLVYQQVLAMVGTWAVEPGAGTHHCSFHHCSFALLLDLVGQHSWPHEKENFPIILSLNLTD